MVEKKLYSKEEKEKFIKKIKGRLDPLDLKKLNINAKMSYDGYECHDFSKFIEEIQEKIIDAKSKNGTPKEKGKLFYEVNSNEYDYCKVTYRAILGWIKTQEIILKIDKSLFALKKETEYFYSDEMKENQYNKIEKVWKEVKEKFHPVNNKEESRSERTIRRLEEKIIRELRSCLGLLVLSNYVTSEKNFEDLKKIDDLLEDFKNN